MDAVGDELGPVMRVPLPPAGRKHCLAGRAEAWRLAELKRGECRLLPAGTSASDAQSAVTGVRMSYARGGRWAGYKFAVRVVLASGRKRVGVWRLG